MTEAAARVGDLVGAKYRLVRFLAEGGMGVVYEAQHTVVRRRFAVKLLRPELASRRDILTRFQREAEAAGALESENVAAAVDFGIDDDGTPYIVMEFLVGESLAALLEREHRLPIARAVDLCLQASRGIQAAHASGIVHRDLKPQNLFVTRRDDGTDLLKVLDFGVAKLQAIDEMNAATRTGTVVGTASYMSPEQARGDKTIDHRGDVYALGAILYELLSGKRPHPGDSHNAILHHISTQPAVPLASVQAGLPEALVSAVEGALASDPGARPPSADAFGQSIAPFARREVWPSGRPDDSGRARADVSSTLLAPGPRPARNDSGRSATTADEGPRVAPVRRHSRAAVAIAAAGVVGILVAVVFAVRTPASTAPRSLRPARSAAPAALKRGPLPELRLFAPPADEHAVQQIRDLERSGARADAAALTALVAAPHAIWFKQSTAQDVAAAVSATVARSARDRQVAVLVAYDLPYRDCAGYGAGGAKDTAAYTDWIESFASGIGSERAIVLLEPDGLAIIPYGRDLAGVVEGCRPVVTDAHGATTPAPGASPDDRFAQLRAAVATLKARAPNAWIYLDAGHSGWLPVGEVAKRLQQAGVGEVQGFFVNSGNYQPTPRSVQYATWISKCLYYADHPAPGKAAGDFAACGSQYAPATIDDPSTWALTDRWYSDNVDHAPNPPGPSALAHFVVDTSRNGRGALEADRYASQPYLQPPAVIKTLAAGGWCNPPGAGAGIRPTTSTGVVLADAYVWIKVPGESDGSCDASGGMRAWDYAKYNPWHIAGEARSRFDPLWGIVDPAISEWFPEQALQLALNADPPFEVTAETTRVGHQNPGLATRPTALPGADAGNHRSGSSPKSHPHRVTAAETGRRPDVKPASPSVIFDQENPYE